MKNFLFMIMSCMSLFATGSGPDVFLSRDTTTVQYNLTTDTTVDVAGPVIFSTNKKSVDWTSVVMQPQANVTLLPNSGMLFKNDSVDILFRMNFQNFQVGTYNIPVKFTFDENHDRFAKHDNDNKIVEKMHYILLTVVSTTPPPPVIITLPAPPPVVITELVTVPCPVEPVPEKPKYSPNFWIPYFVSGAGFKTTVTFMNPSNYQVIVQAIFHNETDGADGVFRVVDERQPDGGNMSRGMSFLIPANMSRSFTLDEGSIKRIGSIELVYANTDTFLSAYATVTNGSSSFVVQSALPKDKIQTFVISDKYDMTYQFVNAGKFAQTFIADFYNETGVLVESKTITLEHEALGTVEIPKTIKNGLLKITDTGGPEELYTTGVGILNNSIAIN